MRYRSVVSHVANSVAHVFMLSILRGDCEKERVEECATVCVGERVEECATV